MRRELFWRFYWRGEFHIKFGNIDLENLFVQTLKDWKLSKEVFVRNQRRFPGDFLKNFRGYLSRINLKGKKILMLGDSTDRRSFKGCMFNIFLDWIFLDELDIDPSEVLLVEFSHTPKRIKNVCSKNHLIGNGILLKILPDFLSIKKRLYRELKESVYESIRGNLVTDLEGFTNAFISRAARFIASYRFFKKVLQDSDVELLFTIDYYSAIRRGAVLAANELGITTVDIQHGLIAKDHIAYVRKDPKSRDDIPKYLLTFGDFYKDIVVNNSDLFDKDKVKPVGNYYIESIRNSPPNLPEQLLEIRKKKNKIALLTSQNIFPPEVYKGAIEKIIANGYYLIIKNHPGDPIDKFKDYESRENITVISDPNFSLYELLKIVDLHVTIHSTSAIDALVFGVPSVLIPYRGYEKILVELFPFARSLDNNESMRSDINCPYNKESFLRSKFLDNISKFMKTLDKNKQNTYCN